MAIDIHPDEAVETSLVELVLAACEWSEDPSEISDLVDWLVTTRAVRLIELEGREWRSAEPIISLPAIG